MDIAPRLIDLAQAAVPPSDPPYTFSGDAPSASRDHIALMNWTDYVLAAATLVVTLNVFTVFVLVRAHQK